MKFYTFFYKHKIFGMWPVLYHQPFECISIQMLNCPKTYLLFI